MRCSRRVEIAKPAASSAAVLMRLPLERRLNVFSRAAGARQASLRENGLRVAAYSDGHGILLDWHDRRALERSAAEWKELVPELRVRVSVRARSSRPRCFKVFIFQLIMS